MYRVQKSHWKETGTTRIHKNWNIKETAIETYFAIENLHWVERSSLFVRVLSTLRGRYLKTLTVCLRNYRLSRVSVSYFIAGIGGCAHVSSGTVYPHNTSLLVTKLCLSIKIFCNHCDLLILISLYYTVISRSKWVVVLEILKLYHYQASKVVCEPDYLRSTLL